MTGKFEDPVMTRDVDVGVDGGCVTYGHKDIALARLNL